uniref:Uncharacterized protein n=1 Tax=Tanacetum cinerariifolium TaxID=118510 RepID=A0A6L2NEQ5_TANCI|nr:hypothetical protein [Tanacetum cinerariifolium]
MFDNDTHQMHYNALMTPPIHSESVIDLAFLAGYGFDRSFFESINTDNFFGPNDPKHLGVKLRLRGKPRTMSLLEFGWRVGLYSQDQSRENSNISGLHREMMVKAEHLLMEFWPTIGNEEFVMGGTSVKEFRDLRVKLAHRCIATTISSRKESTQRIIEIDLFYLYCIYANKVVCNIPYWLDKYLKGLGRGM